MQPTMRCNCFCCFALFNGISSPCLKSNELQNFLGWPIKTGGVILSHPVLTNYPTNSLARRVLAVGKFSELQSDRAEVVKIMWLGSHNISRGWEAANRQKLCNLLLACHA
jgi:hypothetical protein